MRRVILRTMVLILCLVLIGCGQGEDNRTNIESDATNLHIEEKLPEAIINNMTEDEGYYDIQVEEVGLSVYLPEEEFVLGAHYEAGVPVWLLGDENGNVYSYRNGKEKKLLLEGLSRTFVDDSARWWQCGEWYVISTSRFLYIFQKDGTKLCQRNMQDEDRIQGACATENGTVAVIFYNGENYTTNLMELDVQTGEMTGRLAVQEFYGMTGGAGDCVILQDGDGIYTYDLKSGDVVWNMKWGGTTYKAGMSGNSAVDFRLTEDGSVKLFTVEWTEGTWNEETLTRLSYEDIDKTLLVYKTLYASSQLKELIAQFNKQNDTYYIYLDERKVGTTAKDFKERIGIEIATGKGPDIIDGNSVEDIYGLTQKGVLEDLNPYLERAGINKEDYFSLAFSDMDRGTGCYSLNYSCCVRTLYMKEELAQGAVDIESLLRNLTAYEEEVFFNDLYDYYPTTLLHYFLYMSEDFYGMLDWEKGTCEFDTRLWYDMLEMAKRYGKDERKVGLEEIATPVFGTTSRMFVTDDTEARNRGMVPIGYPVEDAMIHGMQVDRICMNAASEHKEGVWAFMEFLLTAQSQQILSGANIPVLKSEFEADYQRDMANPGVALLMDGTRQEIQPEQVEEFAELVKVAQPLPVRTEYVWTIMKEETVDYFNEEKTKEQVTEIIENRISMYMAENM
ncbi:MAG: hypothetical protein IJX63_03675 [Lachnospiraceae bacterium]|nr:hypothetical protein [Lachnospiraceae bacterium]